MFHVRSAFKIFFQGEELAPNFYIFKRIFSGRITLKQIEEQKYGFRRIRDMLSRTVTKNLDAVMAVLVLFEHFLWHILFNFSASNSESFTKYDT